MENGEPLVFTSKGNLPISTLEYFHWWEDAADYTKFVQGYRLDGEVIKQEAHIMVKQGRAVNAELTTI